MASPAEFALDRKQTDSDAPGRDPATGAVSVLRFPGPFAHLGWSEPFTLQSVSFLKDRQRVVLDCSELAYLDLFAFEQLLELVRSCTGRVVVGGVSADVESMFILNHLPHRHWVFRTVEEAARAVQADPPNRSAGG